MTTEKKNLIPKYEEQHADVSESFTITLEKCHAHMNCIVTWVKGTQDECPLCKVISKYERAERARLESELRKEHKSND